MICRISIAIRTVIPMSHKKQKEKMVAIAF